MENWYDNEEDVLGIHIQDKKYWKSIELPNGIVIDISKDGKVIGIEVLRVSKIFSGDVRKVIESAKQNLVVARADYFPDVSVRGLAGLSSIELTDLFKYGSRVPSIGVAIHLPLFDAGLRSARFGAREAELHSAIATYDETVVTAAREVATAASNSLQITAQRRERAVQIDASIELQRTAAARADAGITDLRPQLTADLSLLAQRDALMQLQAAALFADIALQRALGGGYEFKEESNERKQ